MVNSANQEGPVFHPFQSEDRVLGEQDCSVLILFSTGRIFAYGLEASSVSNAKASDQLRDGGYKGSKGFTITQP